MNKKNILKKYFTLIILFFFNNIVAQNFEIREKIISKSEHNSFIDSLYQNKEKNFFFEDENYTVSKICKGEWGGAVIFTNKITQDNFICKSNCPVSIVFYNNSYVLTSTLRHGIYSSEIIEIKRPEKLLKIKTSNYDQNLDLIPDNNTKRWIKIYGYSTLGTFVFKNKIYHIISNSEGTYISKVRFNKFKLIKKITDQRLWSISSNNFFQDDSLIIPFSDKLNIGFLKIHKNQIIYTKTN